VISAVITQFRVLNVGMTSKAMGSPCLRGNSLFIWLSRLILSTAAQIHSLLETIRPSAITGFVITKAIDAIDRLVFRRIAHVGVEVFELLPAFANNDSFATVTLPRLIVWINAARTHINPRFIGA
jgi:hypothetical protein